MNRKPAVIVLALALTAGLSAFVNASYGTLDVEKAIQSMETYIERNTVSDVRIVFSFFISLISAPVTAKNNADGIYRAESIYDDYHYKHVISLAVKDGKIVRVDYDEIKQDGASKRNSADYNARMKAVTGTSPEIAYPIYESRLVEKQNLLSVNAVTGASYTLYRFRMTAVRALMSDPSPADSDSTPSAVGRLHPFQDGKSILYAKGGKPQAEHTGIHEFSKLNRQIPYNY
jgi:major membrane immunogen (membrane-anchored lipoprotein)